MTTELDIRSAAGCGEPAVLFFDVDGTLIWTDVDAIKDGAEFEDFAPNASVQAAFARLRERGHRTYLCTGRPKTLLSQSLMDLGFDGFIAGAGSLVVVDGQTIFESIIPRDVVLEAARLLLDLGIDALFESHVDSVMVSASGTPNPGFPNAPIASSVEDLQRLMPTLACCKISKMSEKEWRIGEFDRLVREHFTECDMGMARELSMKGVDKGAGIRRVLDFTGHSLHNTYAFGDSENDMPMFNQVETTIAMGNAMDHVKERADYVTGDAKDDGIAQALEHFGLI